MHYARRCGREEYNMLNTALKQVIVDALQTSYQHGNDEYTTKCIAYNTALEYARTNGFLSEPLANEELAAVSVAVDMVIKQTPKRDLLAVLSLEFIAENYYMHNAYQRRGRLATPSEGTSRYGDMLGRDKSRPWVAQITGFDHKYGYARTFIYGQADYSQSNGNGSRGVFLRFYLRPGLYEVNERISWKHVRRYFIRVENTTITEITREEVETWLQQ